MATDNKCEDFPIRHIDSKDIPTWGEDTLPSSAQLLMFVTEKDSQCGQYMPFVYKLDTSFLTPAGVDAGNTATIAGNGASITIPDGETRAAFVYAGSPYDIRLADSDDETVPMFLITNVNADDAEKYDIVTDGIYKFANGHSYSVGYTYYLGLEGQPTTDSASGVKLFDVIDDYRIRVNVG